MSCRSRMLKQQRHQGELRAEPIQLWLSSLAQAASQTTADSQPYKYFHAAWNTNASRRACPVYPYAMLPGELGSKVQMELRGSGMELVLLAPDWTQSEPLAGHSTNPAWTQGCSWAHLCARWSTAHRLPMVLLYSGWTTTSSSAPTTLRYWSVFRAEQRSWWGI